MNFNEYQSGTATTNVYSEQITKLARPLIDYVAAERDPQKRRLLQSRLERLCQTLEIAYVLLGYGGEVAELQNKFKKVIRGDNTLEEFTHVALDEQGDALWYAAQLADQLDHDLDTIATRNLAKLQDRKERNVLRGSGDSR